METFYQILSVLGVAGIIGVGLSIYFAPGCFAAL
jgi:hypothetical protein